MTTEMMDKMSALFARERQRPRANPPIAEVIERLRERARYAAKSNNHATSSTRYRAEDTQDWHDAEAVAALAASGDGDGRG